MFGTEHIGASLNGCGDILCPPPFKSLPGHHTVLDGKDSQKEGIDGQGQPDGNLGFTIDGVGHAKVSHKAHGIQEDA